jgi:glutamyl-Q tRNA(Asp) synthetase
MECGERIESGESHAWRLDVERAIKAAAQTLVFDESGLGPSGEKGQMAAHPEIFGDAVLARKDTPTSYHLAVVVDDALQGVTLVTRGNDLFQASHLQRLLQALLGLEAPRYRHHRLINDASGRRLAKRDAATALKALRESGWTADRVREELGFTSR